MKTKTRAIRGFLNAQCAALVQGVGVLKKKQSKHGTGGLTMGGSVSLIDGHIDEVVKPCGGCYLREGYAARYGTSWHDGEDCPYECPPYRDWKEVDA